MGRTVKRVDTRKGDRHKTPRKGDRHKTPRKGDRHKTPRKGDRHRADHKRKNLLAVPFSVVDGEATSDGLYNLLGACDGAGTYTCIENPHGLTSTQCFDFLLGLGVREVWGFSVGYDVNQWLVSLSEDHLRRLSDTNVCYYGPYKVRHIPGKVFQVWRREQRIVKDPDTGEVTLKWVNLQGVTVWDVFSFVTTSFVRWVEEWGLCDDTEWLAQMKAKRADFSASDAEDVKRYNALELELLHAGVQRLKALVQAAGYRPTTWYSPGSIAAKALGINEVQAHKSVPILGPGLVAEDDRPPELRQAIEDAYYGGRFEVAAVGFLRGPIYHYDIRSAYPAAAVDLPDLAWATWEHITGAAALRRLDWRAPGCLALLRISWTAKDPLQTWGPFPIRSAGFLRFPTNSKTCPAHRRDPESGERWYWACEVAAGEPLASVRVLEAWVLRPATDYKPFAWLADMYRRRQALKAAGDEAQYVLKLIINSVYGKLAQKDKPNQQSEPRYRDKVWAGLITAQTRAKLLRAITQGSLVDNPVVMLATDGLFSTAPLDLEIGPNLGQWEAEQSAWIVIVQSGIYYYKAAAGGLQTKARGLRRHMAEIHKDVYAYWKGRAGSIASKVRRFVGYRQALAWNNLGAWRTWTETERQCNMSCEPKRVNLPREGLIQRSLPPSYIGKKEYLRDRGDKLLIRLDDAVMCESLSDTDQPN